MVVHARRALLGSEIVSGVVVATDDAGRITEVRPGRSSDPPAIDGLVVPGLVNAHLHLELSWALGAVPGGLGLPAWVLQLQGTPRPDDAREHARRAAEQLRTLGTAVACDISNAGDTSELLREAGVAGVVQHEVLGMARCALTDPTLEAKATAAVRWEGEVAVRPSPHGTYSVPERWLRAAGATRAGVVGSIHLQEDVGEVEFVQQGTGPFAVFLDALGLDWGWYAPAGKRPVEWLADLGLLGPDLLLVHGVHLSCEDLSAVAAARAPVCLCPRSNLHITGMLPPVHSMLEAGIRICLGTDSLASSPDLDVLAEVATLMSAFPDVPALTWLCAVTQGGADALQRPEAGLLRVGGTGGVLLLEGVDDPRALCQVPPRRWLVPPGGVRG